MRKNSAKYCLSKDIFVTLICIDCDFVGMSVLPGRRIPSLLFFLRFLQFLSLLKGFFGGSFHLNRGSKDRVCRPTHSGFKGPV